MKFRAIVIGILCMVMLVPSAIAGPPPPSPTDACITSVHEALAHVQRIYRMRLLGRKPARLLPAGSTLYDKGNRVWIKVDADAWKTEHDRATMKTDDAMDRDAERDELQPEPLMLRGIFETPGVLTSSLIPSLELAYEGLDCRARAECIAVDSALSGKAPGEDGFYRSTPDGCVEIPVSVAPACRTGENVSSRAGSGIRDPMNTDTVRRTCAQASTRLLSWEAQMLKLLTAYDAASRTVRQIAGILDIARSDLRSVLVSPLRDVTTLLLQLEFPCLVSQCG